MNTSTQKAERKLITNELLYRGIKGVADLFPERIESGNVVIDPYHFKEDFSGAMFNFRQARDAGREFIIREGDYVRLLVDGQMMMSDTGMERISNHSFIQQAHGRVLIAGLGLGMVIRNIVDKSCVESITVVEKNPHVIKLVAPKVAHRKLTIAVGDIFDYKKTIPKERRFDTIYFDIWPDITTENLEEIKKLHNLYKFHLDRTKPGYYMASWMQDKLRRIRREENRPSRYGRYW